MDGGGLSPDKKPKWQAVSEFFWEMVRVAIISLAIILPVRYFLIQPFYVKGASMEPNFYDHEYLIIDEISYRLHTPKRGDIVVFRYPLNPQEYFIKRIIGLPGEKVEIKDGEVRIINKEHPDGIVVDEPYLTAGTRSYSTDEDPVALSDKEYFVMGDNRNASKDSRSFGPVNQSFLTGKVLLRGWPFNRVNVFETPAYQF